MSAGVLFAVGFIVLVGFLGYPLVKLGKVFDEMRLTVRGISEGTLPLLSEVTATVSTTNAQLVKVDTITSNVAQVSTNVSALTSLFAATPLIVRKVGRAAQAYTPEGIGRSLASLGDGLRELADVVREGMAEREQELRQALGADAGQLDPAAARDLLEKPSAPRHQA
jgi:uncharacterized protein YoxC